MPDINLSPYTVEQQAIDRRRRMAELLQQQAAAPMEMPSMPGVRSSPFAGLAKLLQGYGASQTLQNVDTEQKALGEKYQTERTNQFQDLARLLSAPAQAAQPAVEPKFTEGQSTITQGGQAAMPARPAGYLPVEALSQFTHPEIQQLAMSRVLSQLEPKAPIKLGADESLLSPTNYEVLAAGKSKETFHPPINEFDPNSGQTLKVAYSNLGTRKVIDTAGAYTPDQWNSMPLEAKAKLLFDQYKFGNLSAEQLIQAGQKNAQLGQELQKLQFETGKGGPGPVPISANAPMPNLANPAVNPAVNPAAPASVVAPVNKSKVPYTPLFTSKLQTPEAFAAQTNADKTIAPEVKKSMIDRYRSGYPDALAEKKANAKKVTESSTQPAPQLTSEDQPPAGLSPKAQQQWILENAKNQIQATKDKPQAELSATTALTNLSRMKSVAQELSQHKGLDNIVGKWNQYSIFDTSDNAINARALQGTLVKQSATASLQAMRDASKTGGAVGSVSEKEWPILEQQIAALDSAQTPKAYKVALQNLQSQVDSSMTNIRKAYEIQHGKLEFTPPKYYKQDEVQPSAWKVVK